jgi:hypothetical protein
MSITAIMVMARATIPADFNTKRPPRPRFFSRRYRQLITLVAFGIKNVLS